MTEKTVKKKILLVVDDDEIHLSVARRMLEDKYECLTADSGKKALDYFLKGQFPNLVLLDVFMPDMDGWETYKRIQALSFLKDIPIAFLTSASETEEKEHAFALGAADFITKPYEKKDLLKRINKIIKNKEGPDKSKKTP